MERTMDIFVLSNCRAGGESLAKGSTVTVDNLVGADLVAMGRALVAPKKAKKKAAKKKAADEE